MDIAAGHQARILDFPGRFNAAEAFLSGPAALSSAAAGRPAFRYRGHNIAFPEIADLVSRAAGTLLEMGLRREQRVLLALRDSPEFVAAFFGAIKAGIVPVPIHTLVGADDLRYYLEDSGAAALILDDDLADGLRPALPAVTISPEKLATGPPLHDAAPTHPDDIAFWLYTSGSTGKPKGAVHLQRDMIYGADLFAIPTHGLAAGDRIYSASKMFFAYGLGNSLYCPLRAGACAVLVPERSTPETCLRTIHEERPTIFYAVPTLYAAILSVTDAESRFDTSSLRLAVSAGEALPAELYHRFRERFGVEIIDGIGSTEMVHVFISNRPGQVRPGSSGRVVPGYAARIVDEDGHDVAIGETGNLLVSGGSAAAFYWRKAAETRRTMLGEWLRTGDKYRQDADGFYWYCGRADDMMRAGAQWVSPVEVESALVEHSAVLECGVAAVADADGISRPCAFVVLRAGRTVDAGELRAFLQARLAHYKVPHSVQFVQELYKTPTGKIQRFRLREEKTTT